MSIQVSKSMKLQSLPFHPFLVVLFQILTIYAANVNTADIVTVMYILPIFVLCTAVFFLLISFITKDIKRPALVATFFVFLFFTYGRLCDIVYGSHISGMVLGRHSILFLLYALIFIVVTLWIFRSQWCKKHINGITYFFNMFSFGLLLVALLIAITSFNWSIFGSKSDIESKKLPIKKEAPQISRGKKNLFQPNVYFMIFDSYASHGVLKKYFEWDDSGVVDALRIRGFSVNKNAHSNYSFTFASLAATLNMRYIHEDKEFANASSQSGYFGEQIRKNKVMERFKSEGYNVVLNEWFMDKTSVNKGRVLSGESASFFSDGFVSLVINVSMLRPFANIFLRNQRRQVILNELKELKQINLPNKPSFIFYHVICPHQPFFFKADGSIPKLSESYLGRFEDNNSYIEQVRFIGTQLTEIVDKIRSHDPNAVIIVQADHGFANNYENYAKKRKIPQVEFMDAKLGILSAIYLPHDIKMPEEITPVNLFRYVFNAFFNDKLEILPDRNFFNAPKEPYAFYEVTNDLKFIKGGQY